MAGLLVFGFSTYLINLINYRGNIGEVISYCLFPWLLWMVEKLKDTKITTFTYLSMIALSFSFLLSHNVTVMFGIPLLLVYGLIVLQKDQQTWKKLSLLLGYSICLSLWFWLPAVAEKSFTILDSADLSVQFDDQFVIITMGAGDIYKINQRLKIKSQK